MNIYDSISHKSSNKKLKLYFTKKELTRILQYYSIGVAKGAWRDYSIDFKPNGAYFHIYKNFSEKPIISISKKKLKKNNNFFLEQGLNKFTLNDKLENLSVFVKRLNLKIVKK